MLLISGAGGGVMPALHKHGWIQMALIVGLACVLAFGVFLLSAAPGGAPGSRPPNPFANARWYINPASNAQRQAAAWRATRPADAALMDQIARQPSAEWLGEWSGEIQAAVDQRVTAITAAGA